VVYQGLVEFIPFLQTLLGLAFSSVLKKDVVRACEMSVDFNQTTRHYSTEHIIYSS
jgi:hypothetical protein